MLFQRLFAGHLFKAQIAFNKVRRLSISLNVFVNMIEHDVVTRLYLRVRIEVTVSVRTVERRLHFLFLVPFIDSKSLEYVRRLVLGVEVPRVAPDAASRLFK